MKLQEKPMEIEPSGVIFSDVCAIQSDQCAARERAAVTAVWGPPGRTQINVCGSCMQKQVRDGEWKIRGASVGVEKERETRETNKDQIAALRRALALIKQQSLETDREHPPIEIDTHFKIGDIVELFEDSPTGTWKKGDWGKVIRIEFHDPNKQSPLTAFYSIQMAGYCVPENSIFVAAHDIPMWKLRSKR